MPVRARPSLGTRLRATGIGASARVAVRRVIRRETLGWFEGIGPLVRGQVALEIGGPSDVFGQGRLIPVYPLLARCDLVDFSRATLWNSGPPDRTAPGPSEGPARAVMETTRLDQIPDGSYGVVLSSHVLEHTSNPRRALRE
jgi:hypothetical protein